MTLKRVFNFGAGPATLPLSVLERIREEFLDYQGIGASIIEISHRSKAFETILNETDQLFRELVALPKNYQILYVHGGARMQFSALPLNLLGRSPTKKALYFESGNFAKLAREEATKYGKIEVVSSANTNYDRIPSFDPQQLSSDLAYVHITTNNTLYGTRWQTFPETGNIPLVGDSTSEILSRVVDYSRFGVIYASFQKNLGPAGMALVCIREDLLSHALPETPTLLNYSVYHKDHSLTNTTNTFAIYVLHLMLQWLKEQGGVSAIEAINEEKAQTLYQILDQSSFYKGVAHPEHRSRMNVTFTLPNDELQERFLKEALKENLYELKGHRNVGGVRASIYNPMPLEGIQALAVFMKEFEKKNG